MNKYTPGPWKIGQTFSTHNVPIRFWEMGVSAESGAGLVASSSGASRDEVEANAQLIAAAPELLEALKAYRFMEQTNGGVNPHREGTNAHRAFELGRMAIAKAEGRLL